MSEFQKKYNINETQMRAMIKDGWLTCSLPHYDEVIIHYKSSQSMQKTADHFGISKGEVHYIINKLK
jgi:hypothetical protein